jgi:delta-aminolevulinic acid dehydratase/porphobilinogen synthase
MLDIDIINVTAPLTLLDLLKLYPEVGNLPMVVYNSNGHYDWIGASGTVYISEEETEKVLVFSGN